jgi:hypothetical protein
MQKDFCNNIGYELPRHFTGSAAERPPKAAAPSRDQRG